MKVIVGMSGGVDSSVTAMLLKNQGHDVTGVFMKNWKDDTEFCSSEEDYLDVQKVAEALNVPYYSFNFTQEYWDHVFKLFLEAFEKGYTPNPDILCNKEIKFKFFLEKALALGADKIATGHYARVRRNEETGLYELLRGRDNNKDQSYFLCLLTQEALSKTLFPLGEIEKDEVRKLALEADLAVAKKKDSTGICFIGERKFNDFLSGFLPAQPGDIVDLDGNKLGEHQGTMYYTIGQRRGIGIGGPGDPLFVVDKDTKKNLVVVARGENNPALFNKKLQATDWHWIAGKAPETVEAGKEFKCLAQVRYRQDPVEVILKTVEANVYDFEFIEAQRAVTPGQQIVLYDNEVCLGGGVIINRSN